MCGIVGVLSSEGHKGVISRKDYFTQALLCDVLRGYDSTGMFAAGGKEKSVDFMKRALPSWEMQQYKLYDQIVDKHRARPFMIGHNRAATRGKVVANNAHPFEQGNIVGVHNGTITSIAAYDKFRSYVVDSEALIASIAELGARATFASVCGAFAVVWYDTSTDLLHMIRNDERPLALGVAKNENTVLVASEAGMLRWLSHRNGIKLDNVILPNAGQLITIDASNVKDIHMEAIPLREVYVPPRSPHYNRTYGGPAKLPAPVEITDSKESQKRRQRNLKSLANYKLSPNSSYKLIACDFQPYPNTKERGRIVGCLDDHGWYDFIIHNVTQAEYDRWTGGDTEIWASPVSVSWEDNTDYIMFLNSSVRAITSKKAPAAKGGKLEEKEGEKLKNTTQPDVESKEKKEDNKDIPGPNKVMISQKRWDVLTKHGCCVCTDNVYSNTADFVSWTYDNQPICPHCTYMDQEH